jgi:hypothetical protein
MDTEICDAELVAQLKRLDSGATSAAPGFDYEGLLARHAAGRQRARRRLALARGTAAALVAVLVIAGVWRFERPGETATPQPLAQGPQGAADPSQPRIVRADTYLALAALEDHIARVDDAINVARAYSPQGAEVARLERTRNELLDSYAQVRYAELVSANF